MKKRMLAILPLFYPAYAHAGVVNIGNSLAKRLESATDSALQFVSDGGVIAMALAGLIVAVVLVFLLIMMMKR